MNLLAFSDLYDIRMAGQWPLGGFLNSRLSRFGVVGSGLWRGKKRGWLATYKYCYNIIVVRDAFLPKGPVGSSSRRGSLCSLMDYD